MARTNRRDVVAVGEVQVFHCVNRCVRRAYLCGRDPVSGKDFEVRREWIRGRLEFLAGVMGVEVLGYCVMSNHVHCILRSRPDVVEAWTADEVALKWWNLCPGRRNKDGSPAEPTEFELNSIGNDQSGMKEKRLRLSSVSWFMRFLSERIAKLANRDDECTGRFWEGRFKAQPLLDEEAILACMQYVDLNPIRAAIATSPETSDFTSAQDRIADACGECSVGSFHCSENSAEEAPSSGLWATFSPAAGEKGQSDDDMDDHVEHGPRAGWLSPIGEPAKRKSVREKVTTRRASNKGCLPMALGDYLQLLDWTGRQILADKRGAMPQHLESMFERLGISAELWVDCVVNFRRWFRSSVGRPKSMQSAAESRGHNRAISIRSARNAFA